MVEGSTYSGIHSPVEVGSFSLKLTISHLKMMVSNRNLLFQGRIFRCYVSFREGFIPKFTRGFSTIPGF